MRLDARGFDEGRHGRPLTFRSCGDIFEYCRLSHDSCEPAVNVRKRSATMPEFQYQDPFPLAKDDTRYRLLTKEYVSVAAFNGKEILVVDPEGLAVLAN
jgi:hypothetical protein